MKLEQWSVGRHKRDQYRPPEDCPPCLHGFVTGHPKKADGSEITTSLIIRAVGDAIETESGSLYELGEVDPEYEARYPNARARLFEQYRVS